MFKLDEKVKKELDSYENPSIYTNNSLLKFYISKFLWGVDLTNLSAKKIKVIYIENPAFSNSLGISFKTIYSNHKTELILKEIEYYSEVFKDSGVEFNINNFKNKVKPYGINIDNSCKIPTFKNYSDLQDIFIKSIYKPDDEDIQGVYGLFYKYIFYIFDNITNSQDIQLEYYNRYQIVTAYFDILDNSKDDIPKSIQNIIDKITLEFIEFPFLIELIDEITVYLPMSGQNSIDIDIINDCSVINNDTKLINIIDTQTMLYSYQFSRNFKDYALYSNPLYSSNLIIDTGTQLNPVGKLGNLVYDFLESLFIENNITNYSKLFCILDETGKGTPQLNTDLPVSSDCIGISDIRLADLKVPIYKPYLEYNSEYFEKEDTIKNTTNVKTDIGGWEKQELMWGQGDETTSFEENKTGNKNRVNESAKIAQKRSFKISKTAQNSWFFNAQNSIPFLKYDKSENNYKNLYNSVIFNDYLKKLESMNEQYINIVSLPEYDIVLDTNNINMKSFYPELSDFPDKYVNITMTSMNPAKIYNQLNESNRNYDKILDMIENDPTYNECKSKNFEGLFHITKVDGDELKNDLEYNSDQEIKDDIFKLAVGDFSNTNLYSTYRELYYTDNLYNGETIVLNDQEIDEKLALYMYNENKEQHFRQNVEQINMSAPLWQNLYVNIYLENNKTDEENNYFEIDYIKDKIIELFYLIINS